MNYYLTWIPLTFFWYVAYTWFVVKNNEVGGWWFWAAAAFGAFPLWVLISKHSKNVMFDGMIYDVILFLGCAIGAGIFTGKIASFNTLQWFGFVMIVAGLFLVKYK